MKKEIQSLMSDESSCQMIKCIIKLCQVAQQVNGPKMGTNKRGVTEADASL